MVAWDITSCSTCIHGSTRRPVLLFQFVHNTQVDDVKIYHLWSVSTVTCMFTCMEMIVLILAIQVSVLVSLVLSVTFIEFFLLLVDLMPRCNFFLVLWCPSGLTLTLLGCYDSHLCWDVTIHMPFTRTVPSMPFYLHLFQQFSVLPFARCAIPRMLTLRSLLLIFSRSRLEMVTLQTRMRRLQLGVLSFLMSASRVNSTSFSDIFSKHEMTCVTTNQSEVYI